MEKNLTERSLFGTMITFAVPYLISCFLQTFYGMADLFFAGKFNGAATITAVATGSQVIHMLTVIIAGLAMGSTVSIAQAVGARNKERTSRAIGNSITVFVIFTAVATVLLLLLVAPIVGAVQTPAESVTEAQQYLRVCFIGVPFIVAYNVISSIFRGLGDSRSPMIFVGIAGVINMILDYILMGPFAMGARGAAIATMTSQAISVCIALFALGRFSMGVSLSRRDLWPDRDLGAMILKIGIPVACQDGFIQISFLVITAIANSRGTTMAASVGIVEKIISFLFLVNSAMLSTISAIAAQSLGAGKRDRAREVLFLGMRITFVYGLAVIAICELFAPQILSLFVKDDAMVVVLGAGYLRAYVFDTVFAGMHFSFSGYFCACERSILSFIHNTISILAVRIPGAYLASVLWPATLVPMGIATAAGSFVSVVICVIMFLGLEKKQKGVNI